MAQLSVSKAFNKGIELYRNNWILLITAYTLVSGILLIQQFIGIKNTKVVQQATLKDILTQDGSGQTVAEKVQKVFAVNQAPLTKNSTANKLITILSFLLFCLLQLGLIRICLDLYDKKDVSLSMLWSQGSLLLPFVGGLLLFFIGIILATTAFVFTLVTILKIDTTSQLFFAVITGFSTFLSLWAITQIALWAYYLVDKRKGMLGSFSSAFNLIKKAYVKFPLFIIAFVFVQMTFQVLFTLLLQSIFSVSAAILFWFASLFILPLFYTSICSSYRQLQPQS